MQTLPDALKDSAAFVYYGNYTSEERKIGGLVEQYRRHIADLSRDLHSFSSPHSGTFEKDADNHAAPGPYIKNSAKAHAMTGIDMKGGILLRRMVTGLGGRRILELGTNTGFSGCYLLSSSQIEQLVTIEGSEDLCEIADQNLKRISDKYRIMNKLFEDAIDQLLGGGKQFDCIFIDGQHERSATWHYTNKVLPLLCQNGAIIYDDIYWSNDMNQFWRELCASPEFPITIDLQSKGVALSCPDEIGKRHHDICAYVGRPGIYRKEW